MATSTKPATSTGTSGKDKDGYVEQFKNFMKQCCECWKRRSDDDDESSKDKNNPSPTGPKGSGFTAYYATPRSDLDDNKGQGGYSKKDQDTGDSGGYKGGVKETSFSKPDPPPLPPLPPEPYRPQLDQYGVHTMENFPFRSFKTDTYKGVHDEVLFWVKPLHHHPRLQGAFLNFAQPPKLMEKLELLSKTLQGTANALSTKKKVPHNKHKELAPVLDELSHDPGIKLDQIKSLVIVCEAMKEFPRHIVELCVKSLTPDKRQRLIEFIWCIPHGTNKKVFTDPDSAAIFMDPDLQPIMKRIGFKKETFSSDLIWDSPDEGEEDRLGAALFLLEGSRKKYMH